MSGYQRDIRLAVKKYVGEFAADVARRSGNCIFMEFSPCQFKMCRVCLAMQKGSYLLSEMEYTAQKGSYLLSEMEYTARRLIRLTARNPGCWASAKSASQFAVTLTSSRRSVVVAASWWSSSTTRVGRYT